MTQALFTSMTGLNAGTEQLTVVSDNVANMNTTAYKTSRVDFQDIWYKTKTTGTNSTKRVGGTNPYQIGVGVKCASISKDFSASSVNTTGRSEDMAITGKGWFTVVNSDGKMLLTRDGTFALDENGYLCTANGFKVLGTDASVSMLNSTDPIKIPMTIKVDEYPTKKETDSRGDGEIKFGDIKLSDLNALGTTTSGFTAGTFYVAVGSEDFVEVKLTEDDVKEGVTVEELKSTINGQLDDVTVDIADGVFTFKSTGSSKDLTFKSGTSNFVTATGIASSARDANDIYNTRVLNYTATITQMDDITADTTKMYESFSVGQDGIITVSYSDGSTLTIQQNLNDNLCAFVYTDANGVIIEDNNANTGDKPLYVDPNVLVIANMQMQLAKVQNDSGLVAVGNNQYTIGVDCGTVIYTSANQNGVGAVVSGALESSNVDLAQQFANMILAQRLVQANSQVFNGANSMLETLVYLGR